MKYCIIAKEDKESQQIKQELINNISIQYSDNQPDYVICVGGDGTILKAIHTYKNNLDKTIFFGIHTGRLGFFTNFQKTEYLLVADLINKNSVKSEEYKLLSYKISGDKEFSGFALNEITIVNPLRTLVLDVYIENELLQIFRGTGICVSTTYGSTAYNKSLHGAVVDPMLEAIQMTEIASINSNAYRTLGSPLVLNYNRSLKFNAEDNLDLWITADNESFEITDFKELLIFNENKVVRMANNINQTFFNRVKRAFINKS